ncbi:MAG TPA: 16S rRNA (guanine(527)-N(7))-methyltransferase RsmG, partial [Burkholderiaceae bacterium]|nr:16S rRNA (guanine(527)-N(7))-methyltransferase RsmG [Burkholderiaceae bacterium]
HGLWAAMKGRHRAQESADLPPGVELLEVITLRVPMLREQRHLVLLRQRGMHSASAEIAKP